LLLSTASLNSYAQTTSLEQELAELDAELDAIFANESDSTSLLALLDALINADQNYSEIQFRMGYSSRVTSAGRDFGVDQQGLTPGVSFYHHSGFFADATGFWNSELDPKYNLTVLTAGYLGRIGKRTTYSLSYDHSFFTEYSEYNTLTNSLSAAASLNFKNIYTGLDYSFSFGTETAHRTVWNVTGKMKTKGFGPIKSVTFFPSVALLFGNQNITNQYTSTDALTKFQHADDRQIMFFSKKLREGGFDKASPMFLSRLRDSLNNNESLTVLQQSAYDQLFLTGEESSNVFGLMNYYFTLPILFETKRINIYLSYNYNIPRNIDGAEYEYESNGYFGFALTYNLQVGKKK
jgi:hypothetical protein